MIDLSKIRPGDEVAIRVTIDPRNQAPFEPGDHIGVRAGGRDMFSVPVDLIVSHTPRALATGDAVKFVGNPQSVRGRIVHVADDLAWVCWNGSQTYHGVQRLAELEAENRA